jgi:hypothetical protein
MTAVTDKGGASGTEPTGEERQPAAGTFGAAVRALPPQAARMVAVEVLLADPAELGDDVLEASLYVFREKLRAAG